jgi:sRNA-binding carbon storage regulator CsrA
MLILQRSVGESFTVDGPARVTMLGHGKVGVHAPASTKVLRAEVPNNGRPRDPASVLPRTEYPNEIQGRHAACFFTHLSRRSHMVSIERADGQQLPFGQCCLRIVRIEQRLDGCTIVYVEVLASESSPSPR